jgi:hypothetical protein
MAENSLKEQYKVVKLQNHEADKWLLEKHYARRKAPISYLFGLTDKEKILGICSFGYPPNMNYNDGKCLFKNIKITTLELNRLVLNTIAQKNILSFFVSSCLKQLPKPTAIVSYADPNHNHYGFIYQATNWMFIGESTPKHRYYFEDGSTFDIRRGIDRKGKIVKKEKIKSTLRYIYLLGSKKELKIMKQNMIHKVLPYPKGQLKNYVCKDLDICYQKTLFENIGDWYE